MLLRRDAIAEVRANDGRMANKAGAVAQAHPRRGRGRGAAPGHLLRRAAHPRAGLRHGAGGDHGGAGRRGGEGAGKVSGREQHACVGVPDRASRLELTEEEVRRLEEGYLSKAVKALW